VARSPCSWWQVVNRTSTPHDARSYLPLSTSHRSEPADVITTSWHRPLDGGLLAQAPPDQQPTNGPRHALPPPQPPLPPPSGSGYPSAWLGWSSVPRAPRSSASKPTPGRTSSHQGGTATRCSKWSGHRTPWRRRVSTSTPTSRPDWRQRQTSGMCRRCFDPCLAAQCRRVKSGRYLETWVLRPDWWRVVTPSVDCWHSAPTAADRRHERGICRKPRYYFSLTLVRLVNFWPNTTVYRRQRL